MSHLTCKIIKKEAETAEIEINGQILAVPAATLPDSTPPGKVFNIFLINPDEAIADKKLAKTILEEILNGK